MVPYTHFWCERYTRTYTMTVFNYTERALCIEGIPQDVRCVSVFSFTFFV